MTHNLRLFEMILQILSMFIDPISPSASTSVMCLPISCSFKAAVSANELLRFHSPPLHARLTLIHKSPNPIGPFFSS